MSAGRADSPGVRGQKPPTDLGIPRPWAPLVDEEPDVYHQVSRPCSFVQGLEPHDQRRFLISSPCLL